MYKWALVVSASAFRSEFFKYTFEFLTAFQSSSLFYAKHTLYPPSQFGKRHQATKSKPIWNGFRCICTKPSDIEGTVQQTQFLSCLYPIKHNRDLKLKSKYFQFWLCFCGDILILKSSPRSKGLWHTKLGQPIL